MIRKNKKNRRGFGLLDVIFAIGLIVVGLLGVIGLFRYVILAGRVSADRFIATNLAQEGIEIVRAIRDTNWKTDPPINWRTNLVAGQYRVQYDSPSLTSCSGSCPVLNMSSGWYSYGAGTASKFRRRIIIYNDATATYCPDDTATPNLENFCVFSEVTWTSQGGSYSATVMDRLYNWR